jgi:glycerate kinase
LAVTLEIRGDELQSGDLALSALVSIDLAGMDPRLQSVCFEVAADVDNPLCGPHGASHTFGRQKDATPEQLLLLDTALSRFADCCANVVDRDCRNVAGVGAAGGMGFAALAFLRAEFRPDVDVVAELVGLSEKVKGAELVITGEGRCDALTLRGKTPIGVARIAREHGAPAVILAGTLGEGYEALYEHGIDAAFALVSGPMSLADACSQTPRLLLREISPGSGLNLQITSL